MYIIINALKNILRNKGRNILISIIIIVIFITSCTALIIQSASNRVINNYKDKFGAQVTITPNIQSIINGGKFEPLTEEQQLKITKSKYLLSYDGNVTDAVDSDSLKAIDQDTQSEIKYQAIGGDGATPDNNSMPNMNLIGYTNIKQDEDFKSGKRKVTEGKLFENNDECIISSDFAKLNSLTIGSTIKVKNKNYLDDSKSINYELKVTGIYTDGTNEYPSGNLLGKVAILNRRNEIITTLDNILSHHPKDTPTSINFTYYLKSPNLLEDFKKEVYGFGVSSKNYDINTDLDSYNNIVKPVDGMKKLSLIFMFIVLILGSVVLILLTTLAMRERKYEIGILRSMGMKKLKIALGLICEITAIIVICLVISLPISITLSKPIGNAVLASQNSAYEQSQQPGQNGNGVAFQPISDLTNTDKKESLKTIDTGLNSDAVLEIIIVALVLTIISSLISATYISRYEPIKILSDCN